MYLTNTKIPTNFCPRPTSFLAQNLHNLSVVSSLVTYIMFYVCISQVRKLIKDLKYKAQEQKDHQCVFYINSLIMRIPDQFKTAASFLHKTNTIKQNLPSVIMHC